MSAADRLAAAETAHSTAKSAAARRKAEWVRDRTPAAYQAYRTAQQAAHETARLRTIARRDARQEARQANP